MKPFFSEACRGGILLLAAVLTSSGCATDQGTFQDFFESGQAYQQEGRHREAVVQFLNALQQDPKHRDARYLLARSYLQQQEWRRAERELKTLLEDNPEDTQAALTLGNLYLNGGQRNPELFRLVQEMAEEVLAREPEHVEALILSGNAAAGLRDLTSSRELLERALGLDPENLTATVNLAALEALRQNYPLAEKAFLRARRLAPTDPMVLLSLSNFYLGTGENGKAEEVLREAFSLAPTNPQVYLTWSRFQLSQGKAESAQEVLQQVQEMLPEDPMPSLFLVDLYLAREEGPAEAQALLEALQERFPESVEVAKKRVLVSRITDPEQARQLAQELVENAPNDPQAWILLGALEFSAGAYEKAETTFEQPFLMSSLYPEPHYYRGRMAELRGEEETAMQGYQEALKVGPRYLPARLALAQLYFRRGLYSDSQAEVTRMLELRQGDLEARLLQVRLWALEGETGQAQQELTALLESHPEEVAVQRLAGRFFQGSSELRRAERHFQEALRLRPQSAEILKDLVQLYLQKKEPQQAIAAIRNQLATGETPMQHDLLGQVYLAGERFEEAQAAFRRAIELDDGRVSSYLLLSTTYLQGGKTEVGLAWIDNLLKKRPDFAPAHSLKGFIQLSQGKLPEARDHYARALELDPRDHAAANNLAFVLGEQNEDLGVALKWAQTARRLEPENADYADTLGWIYYKLERYILARDQLRFATSGKPDDPLLQYHLGMALWKTGLLREATAALQKALQSERGFQERNEARTALQEINRQVETSSG